MRNSAVQQRSDSDAPIRVVMVDDHPVVRDGYRRLLESSGTAVVVGEASDGESGYECYQQHRPDVAIMDLLMPGAGGLHAIRRITQWDHQAQILVFTMHESPIHQARAREAGAIGYISKRCAPPQLLDAVRSVGQGRHYFAAPEDRLQVEDSEETAAIARLTLREFEIFRMLAMGQSVQQIAELLNISQNTVGVHQTRIMNKLGLRNAAQLAHLAIRHEIVRV